MAVEDDTKNYSCQGINFFNALINA